MSVCRCPHDHLGSHVGSRAWPVLDDESLAEPFSQPLGNETRPNVGRTAGRKTNDDMHRSGGVILGIRNVRCASKRRCAGSQKLESTTRQLHGSLLVSCQPGAIATPACGSYYTITSSARSRNE